MLENETDLLTPIVQNDQNNIDMKANIQNIQQFFEASLQKNVDLIFDTIYCYVREDTE